MSIIIHSRSEYLTPFFSRHYAQGHVHSVYRHTINLVMDSQLISLQPLSSSFSPVTLAVADEDFSTLAIAPGTAVHLAGNKLCCQTTNRALSFDTARSHILPSSLSACYPCDPRFLSAMAMHIISRSNADGFASLINRSYDHTDLILAAAKAFLVKTQHQLENCHPAAAAETLSQIIGLGIGLTPSGDDFLCGALAALRACNLWQSLFSRSLRQILASRLSQTNPISAAFLRCALQSHFSPAVLQFFCDPLPLDDQTIQKRFEAIGHSSGMDTLCGISFALSLESNGHLQ
ncbi:DUF2877 domain-containing protein [Pseudoramibacter faecis]|uniref:DUF2877 domain-containing protein n=1 Tax=Pseudoramibacter faecis TaxID=3108534 RepID=UPI002E75EE00|nr:DUF2877 domain-containing protein [Pseudoramibacter sp. HA2172]